MHNKEKWCGVYYQVVAKRTKHTSRLVEVAKDLSPFILFFLVQVFVTSNEWVLTIAAVVIFAGSLYLRYFPGEWKLFLVGLGLGIFIEVLLGIVFQQQFWMDASLFGVPYWLPFAWGAGFVYIRRIGDTLLGKRVSTKQGA